MLWALEALGMRLPIFHVDAFASRRFTGNPAAVVVMDDYPDDDVLHAVAAENNLSETAFLERAGDGWNLRWFTPEVEVPLCGHATLASAWVVLERLARARREVTFATRHSGPLTVRRHAEGFEMDFPAKPVTPVASPPPLLADALGAAPVEVLAHETNYVAVMESAAVVRRLTPNFAAIARLDRKGVVVTAPGDHGFDCVSRYFAPQKGIDEDPVTGAAHCALTPYWSARLGKTELRAYQASRRGGELGCVARGDRVTLRGSCVFYSEGEIELA
jgi:PhzF family phenazine biosynthesis protein